MCKNQNLNLRKPYPSMDKAIVSTDFGIFTSEQIVVILLGFERNSNG